MGQYQYSQRLCVWTSPSTILLWWFLVPGTFECLPPPWSLSRLQIIPQIGCFLVGSWYPTFLSITIPIEIQHDTFVGVHEWRSFAEGPSCVTGALTGGSGAGARESEDASWCHFQGRVPQVVDPTWWLVFILDVYWNLWFNMVQYWLNILVYWNIWWNS